MIYIENIKKKFQDKTVLSGISASFEHGKINLIIGQSGSGKTVLLKSMVGLIDIDEGSIFFDNREFSNSKLAKQRKIRRDLGMVFQGGALFTSQTVEDNVKFPLDMFTKLSKKEKLKKVHKSLEKVNVENVTQAFPSEISGGMQKRVAIARAIVMNPKYLFCDEPNSGLDPITSIKIDNLIKTITDDFKITTIVNTHDMNSVKNIGDKILFLHNGQKWWEGNKESVFKSDNKKLNDFVFASENA